MTDIRMDAILEPIIKANKTIINFEMSFDYDWGELDYFKIVLKGNKYLICAEHTPAAIDTLVNTLDNGENEEMFLLDGDINSGEYSENDYILSAGSYGRNFYHGGDIKFEALSFEEEEMVVQAIKAANKGRDLIIGFEDYLQGVCDTFYEITIEDKQEYLCSLSKQGAIDDLINYYRNIGNTRGFITPEQLASGEFLADEYIIGGYQKTALYHGGDFQIREDI